MCRTILIFNAHCEHEHAEIQKCSDLIASETKWQRKGFFSKLLSSPPRGCKRPQQTRRCTKVQVCPGCASHGTTYEQIRKDRDSTERRPPRPIYRNQTDLDIGNPVLPQNLQRRNAMRQPADQSDQRPQGRQRGNTVQFHGEAPRLPNVRATALFREPENPDPDTLRDYLGASGVPFEDPEITAQRPAPALSPSTIRKYRRRGSTDWRHARPSSTQHPHDNGSAQYRDRPLPPTPLRPRRATMMNPPPTPRPPPVPTRSSSQRHFQPSSEQLLDSRRYSPPRPPQSSSYQLLDSRRYSPPRPSRPSSHQQSALTRAVPQSTSRGPSYHLGMPTDRELNRMSREIDTVESAWINAGRAPSQQQAVVRHSTGSLTDPRRHRSQREGSALPVVGDG